MTCALPVFEPAAAAAEMKARIDRGETCAVLFGGERAGLSNEDVTRADGIVSIPVNPAFACNNKVRRFDYLVKADNIQDCLDSGFERSAQESYDSRTQTAGSSSAGKS